MDSTLTTVLAHIPMWRDHTDIQTSVLSGGISNQNYRVDVDGESFVLRIVGAKTELLGVNRQYEYAANQAAASIGIAPEVIYFDPAGGCLVTRFLQARPIPPEEMREPTTLYEIADTIKRIHSLPPFPGSFSAFQVVRDYDALAREHGVKTFPENYAWLRERMDEIESALKAIESGNPNVPCHNDLLNGNFLRDEKNIYILDWEYGGMGDRFFDLANFSSHHELSDDDIYELLAAYFGEETESQFAHLKLMQAMSDFREAMWGVVQQGLSDLDFDYRGYATQFFDKLTARLSDPRYPQLLKEIYD
jgi:thiamine kinase-like enzyme